MPEATLLRAAAFKIKVLSSIALSTYIGSAMAGSQSIDLRNLWMDQPGAFAGAVQAGAGFSFQYGARTVGPVFDKDWRQNVSDDPKSAIAKATLTHPSGLVVTRETRIFPNFNAVEYKLRFKNISKKTLPAISTLRSLDVSFKPPLAEGACVISSGGGIQDYNLPPRAFSIRRNCLFPSSRAASLVFLSSAGGRSSDKDLPLFLIHNEARRQGVYVAFGWSGQWQVVIRGKSPTDPLQLLGGIPDVDVALEPGEEIEGPTVLIGVYGGTSFDGANQLRRLIRDVYTPKLAGQSMLPVATFNTAYAIGFDFDEPLLKQLADGAAATGQEYFLLDAGWHEGEDWSHTLGNWNAVNRKKLPHGLEPIGGYVRSKGLKLGLWFDLERVSPGTQVATAHPDWVLWNHGGESAPWYQHLPFNPLVNGNPSPPEKFGLLDYGRADVQEYVKGVLERYIREAGVKYIRYDFNTDPLPYWRAADKPNRRGITQLRHIQGLYAVLDWVREHYPDVIVENCASGGNRIDLEMLRRSHTLWIDDVSADPAIIRYHLSGINYFLPGNYSYILYSLPAPSTLEAPDDLGFQSLFGGAFGLGVPLHQWSEPMKAQALHHVQIWKQLRRYLIEDYYPLSPQPSDMDSWSGWQFNDPKDQSGFIQTFRTHAAEDSHRFLLHGLDEKARYRFTDVYGAEHFDAMGSQAMSDGFYIKQAPMSSRVFTYKGLAEGK